ncbi:hypothetical protein EUX98_g9680, partial [Antrodiella citrinella]
MAPKQPCAKYQYVLTAAGPKIVPVPEPSNKDEESPADYNSGGYLPVKVRDTFKDGRYHVLRKLGWGHFSTVWLVKDTSENRHAAMKVVKSAGRYAETARDEIKLLRQVMDAKPGHVGRDHVVSFLDSFQHVRSEDIHVCLVFEPLGENLLALIERHKALGVPVGLVKVIARQVLLGLQYLHDECDLVHTDIKPENIMVSIPDVESHIQAELSISPSPTSRNVGIPPKQARPTVTIPRRGAGRERHVQIFDSQPLSSPLHSASSSPSTRHGLQMSRINSTQSIQSTLPSPRDLKGKGKQGSTSTTMSTGSTPDLSDASGSPSILASSSFTSSSSTDTAPTSLGSAMSGVKKLSMSSPDASRTCTCLNDTFDDAGTEPDA